MNRKMWTLVGLVGLLSGCPRPDDPGVIEEGVRSPFMDPRLEGRPIHMDAPPPPISGGTLFVGDSMILVSDPDRDRIVVVDRIAQPAAVLGVAELPPGAEPGRVILDGRGRAHALLRGAGEVYSFDPVTPGTGERRDVCIAPRGIAYDAASDSIHVGCRGGELVTLPAEGGAATRTLTIDGGDIRDVVIDQGELYVTRFRAAELLHVSPTGVVDDISAPYDAVDSFSVDASGNMARFRPSVAWRAISVPGGGVAMVHQRASDGDLNVAATNAYYSTSLCNGSIIQTAVTFFDGGVARNAPNLLDASVSVDVAISPDRGRVAVVNAGNQSGQASVVVYDSAQLTSAYVDPSFGGATCLYADPSATQMPPVQNAVAASYASDGTLYVQQRNDADGGGALAVVQDGIVVASIDLGGADVFDTGHAIFHGNASRSTACASCHPEGSEDGRTWHFAGIGPRRTPAMHGDVTSTAPFHWDGDLPNLRSLSAEVFTRRMGGPSLTGGQVDALGGWLDELPPPVARRTMDDDAARRGHDIFHGEAQCVNCHSGGMFTNNATVDVGTGDALQVPSLVGVSNRLPVMHDGCALTLHDRFRPDCGGGDAHGRTSHLTPTQIDDLVAYLETL